MKIIILVMIVLLIATGSFWWGTNISDVNLFFNNQSKTNIENTNDTTKLADIIQTPIEMAKEVKDVIEAGSGTTLDLSGQGLTKVPDYVFGQRKLVILNLAHNKLEGALQAEVRFLSDLKILNLSHNNFTGVPAEIGQLTELEVLDLSFNKLTGLPYELGNLSKLQTLDLRGNSYSAADLAIIKEKLPVSTTVLTDN